MEKGKKCASAMNIEPNVLIDIEAIPHPRTDVSDFMGSEMKIYRPQYRRNPINSEMRQLLGNATTISDKKGAEESNGTTDENEVAEPSSKPDTGLRQKKTTAAKVTAPTEH